MCFVLGHITAYGRFSDKRKCGLSLISCQRMYPGDPAHDILPHALVRWRKHLALFQKQGKQIQFICSLLFYFSLECGIFFSHWKQYLLATGESVRFASVRSRVRIPPSPPKQKDRSCTCLFVLRMIWDSNGSGVGKRAGGTFSPRPGLRRSEGRIPPSPPRKNGNSDRIAVLFFCAMKQACVSVSASER